MRRRFHAPRTPEDHRFSPEYSIDIDILLPVAEYLLTILQAADLGPDDPTLKAAVQNFAKALQNAVSETAAICEADRKTAAEEAAEEAEDLRRRALILERRSWLEDVAAGKIETTPTQVAAVEALVRIDSRG